MRLSSGELRIHVAGLSDRGASAALCHTPAAASPSASAEDDEDALGAS